MPRSKAPLALVPVHVALAAIVTGCAGFSPNRLDDCRLRVQSLQSENEQLRDVASNVRNQNREMAMRALDDSRRIRAQEVAIARLERSIAAYQDERDQMAALLDEVRGQVRTAASSLPPTALLDRLRELKRARPKTEVDPSSATVSLAPGPLFVAGESRLTREADQWLAAAGSIIRSYAAQNPEEEFSIEAEFCDSPRPVAAESAAGTVGQAEAKLADLRARALRAELARSTGIDPARVRITAADELKADEGVVRTSIEIPPRVSLRLIRQR
jgi:hypothetical protein